MGNIASIVGVIGGAVGILTGLFSLVYQHRQTHLLAEQVEKEIEVKITRDWDAPEGVDDNKLKAVLNRRLSDVRAQMRQEFNPRIEDIVRTLRDNHIMERRDTVVDAVQLMSDYRLAKEGFQESNAKVNTLEHEVQALQQAVEDIKSGVGNQTMVRAQIRGIAEQLLRMTGQE